jgi:hypothetical protein
MPHKTSDQYPLKGVLVAGIEFSREKISQTGFEDKSQISYLAELSF